MALDAVAQALAVGLLPDGDRGEVLAGRVGGGGGASVGGLPRAPFDEGREAEPRPGRVGLTPGAFEGEGAEASDLGVVLTEVAVLLGDVQGLERADGVAGQRPRATTDEGAAAPLVHVAVRIVVVEGIEDAERAAGVLRGDHGIPSARGEAGVRVGQEAPGRDAVSVLSRLVAQRVEAGGCVAPVVGAPEQLAGLQEGAGDEVGPGISSTIASKASGLAIAGGLRLDDGAAPTGAGGELGAGVIAERDAVELGCAVEEVLALG